MSITWEGDLADAMADEPTVQRWAELFDAVDLSDIPSPFSNGWAPITPELLREVLAGMYKRRGSPQTDSGNPEIRKAG